jgi:hypothetical protein
VEEDSFQRREGCPKGIGECEGKGVREGIVAPIQQLNFPQVVVNADVAGKPLK